MTRREQLLQRIHENLAKFIDDEDTNIVSEACLYVTARNIYPCPYGEEYIQEDCIKCINQYLDMEIDE